MPRLDVVPLFMSGRRHLLDRLATSLGATLQVTVRQRQPWFDPEASFDPTRGQYNSTLLLRQLLRDPSTPPWRAIAVASVDLFTPILTYVFGEAQLEGRTAVVSLHRLRAEAYGLAADEELLFRRLLKESLHELGHTFGLVHCLEAACVMRASTYVEEIDFKSTEFCGQCLELVRSSGGRSPRVAESRVERC